MEIIINKQTNGKLTNLHLSPVYIPVITTIRIHGILTIKLVRARVLHRGIPTSPLVVPRPGCVEISSEVLSERRRILRMRSRRRCRCRCRSVVECVGGKCCSQRVAIDSSSGGVLGGVPGKCSGIIRGISAGCQIRARDWRV